MGRSLAVPPHGGLDVIMKHLDEPSGARLLALVKELQHGVIG